jgi:hypothetical protein
MRHVRVPRGGLLVGYHDGADFVFAGKVGTEDVGSCVSNGWTLGVVGSILAALVVIAPIVTAIYLSRRLRQTRLASSADAVDPR